MIKFNNILFEALNKDIENQLIKHIRQHISLTGSKSSLKFIASHVNDIPENWKHNYPMTVYRGLSLDNNTFFKLINNGILSPKEPIESWTENENTASSFARESENSVGVILKKNPKKSDVVLSIDNLMKNGVLPKNNIFAGNEKEIMLVGSKITVDNIKRILISPDNKELKKIYEKIPRTKRKNITPELFSKHYK